MDTKAAALEYARQMHQALRQADGELRAFSHWKRLFEQELTRVRYQERLRMAQSQDWSDLGRYVREGFTIVPHRLLLDAAGLIFRLGFPGAQAFFAGRAYRSCGKVLRTMTSISGQG